MTSAISPPRRLLADCSPSTQRTASTTFDLPDPFGPTTAVTPGGKSNAVLSAKLLKPTSSRRFSIGWSARIGALAPEGRQIVAHGASRGLLSAAPPGLKPNRTI